MGVNFQKKNFLTHSITVVMADADQPTNSVIEIASSEALILKGHQNEVFSCAWNPQIPLMVASGWVFFFILALLSFCKPQNALDQLISRFPDLETQLPVYGKCRLMAMKYQNPLYSITCQTSMTTKMWQLWTGILPEHCSQRVLTMDRRGYGPHVANCDVLWPNIVDPFSLSNGIRKVICCWAVVLITLPLYGTQRLVIWSNNLNYTNVS